MWRGRERSCGPGARGLLAACPGGSLATFRVPCNEWKASRPRRLAASPWEGVVCTPLPRPQPLLRAAVSLAGRRQGRARDTGWWPRGLLPVLAFRGAQALLLLFRGQRWGWGGGVEGEVGRAGTLRGHQGGFRAALSRPQGQCEGVECGESWSGPWSARPSPLLMASSGH